MRSFLVAIAVLIAACGSGATTVSSTTTNPVASTTAPTQATTTTAATTTVVTEPPTTTTVAATYDLVPADVDPPVVTVIDPGQEPRQVIEYELEPGATVSSVMEMGFGTSQELGGELLAESDLLLTMELTALVVDVQADGFVVESLVTGVDVGSSNADVVETLEDIYAFLPGSATYILMAPSGAILASDDSQLASLIAASGQDIDFSPAAVAPPFPADPVGVGARWTVVSEIVQEFVAISQTITYELVSIDGSVLTLELALEQEMGDTSPLTIGLENGEATYQASALGTVVFDLRRAMPLSSTMDLDQLIVIRGTADGTEIDVVTRNYTTLTVTSR